MPTSTSRYRFEYRLLEWAESLCRDLHGGRSGLFVGLRSDGTVRRIVFAAPDERLEGERKAKLTTGADSWFLFAPYDEPGTGYLEWLDLPATTVERWLRRPLEVVDFQDVRTGTPLGQWPPGWRVIIH